MADILRHPSVAPVHRGRLDAMELVPACGSNRSFIETQVEASWFRTAIYRVILTHHGVQVAERGTFCDVGMLFSGQQDAIAAARRAMLELHITSASSLRAEVRLDVQDEPSVPRPRPSYSTFDHWARVPRGLFHRDLEAGRRWLAMLDAGKNKEAEAGVIREIAAVDLVRGYVAWSTHAPATLAEERTALLLVLAAQPFHLDPEVIAA